MSADPPSDRIETFGFDDIPLNRDIYLRPELDLDIYLKSLRAVLEGQEEPEPGTSGVAFAAARGIEGKVMHLSWYPNISDRFHEVRVRLPRSAFVAGIDCWYLDEKPSLFLREDWLEDLYRRSYSLFAMVDAIDVKRALLSEQLTSAKLMKLQQGLDDLAASNPDMMFISFADSVLIKSNWRPVEQTKGPASYTPERLIVLLERTQVLFNAVVGLDTYAVVTQGGNEFSELVHLSKTGNHLSLNSLGLPFAQILSIDHAVRSALRSSLHPPAEIYMDSTVLSSLQLPFEFDKDALIRAPYEAPLAGGPASYVMSSRADLLHGLRPQRKLATLIETKKVD